MTYTGTSTAWTSWAGTDTSTSASPVWTAWNQDTSATTSTVWRTWTSDTTSITQPYRMPATVHTPRPRPTREQVAEANRQQVERQAETARLNAEYAAKQAAAKAKAEALLCAHLTEEQERAWKQNRAIFVTGQSGKRFRIREGRAGNIEELDATGTVIGGHCVHVAEQVPDADNVLAQKLALEHHEEATLQLANSHPVTNGTRYEI